MKILYGVTGEGMGHATRSQVVLRHLARRGHAVTVAASGRAHALLAQEFPALKIEGLELKYVDGALDQAASALHNVARAPVMLAVNAAAFRACERLAPDAVVSDFDSFAYLFAKARGLPVLSVDNLQMVDRCQHPAALEADPSFPTARRLVQAKLPGCDAYLVTTFFYPPVRPEYAASTQLVPPVLREPVLRARPSHDGPVLVYQTSTSDAPALLAALRAVGAARFVVYGLGRDEALGNCVLKRFSERGFVDDLARARAVVANGGMSLLGEAVALGKPVYSVPVRAHFEQAMNAHYLAALEYGVTSRRLCPDRLGRFLRDAPYYAARLAAAPRHDGNAALLRAVDGFVAGR